MFCKTKYIFKKQTDVLFILKFLLPWVYRSWIRFLEPLNIILNAWIWAHYLASRGLRLEYFPITPQTLTVLCYLGPSCLPLFKQMLYMLFFFKDRIKIRGLEKVNDREIGYCWLQFRFKHVENSIENSIQQTCFSHTTIILNIN